MRIGSNWISAALTLGSTGAALRWPNVGTLLMIAAAVVLLAGVRFDGFKLSIHWVDRKRLGHVGIALVVMACLLLIALFGPTLWTQQFGSSFVVYEPFVSIYNIHRNLGKPIAHQQTTAVYFAKYEQGIVIYLPIPNIHYVLPRDQVNRTVLVSNVIQKIPNGSPYFEDVFVRQRLKIPVSTNKRPPVGGIAVEWEKNPKQWEWLGGREWQLAVENPPQNYIQYFESGIIIGPFPDSFELNTGWMIYAVFNDTHKWAQEVTSLTLSKPYRLER